MSSWHVLRASWVELNLLLLSKCNKFKKLYLKKVYIRNQLNFSSRKSNSTQWPMFRSAESICKPVQFLKIQCIYLSIASFLNIYLQKCYKNCRRKLHSMKSERLILYICLHLWVFFGGGGWRKLKDKI